MNQIRYISSNKEKRFLDYYAKKSEKYKLADFLDYNN